ncbi:MAG: LUD domain-containing protein [Tannerellaceae bacterium]|jgi:L-lactate dehydrogenase complex protein LldF|nr:LUD domain-containing protein [Tannerellaceae bacterium]
MSQHSKKARRFLADAKRAAWHDETLWMVRCKRDRAAEAVDDWENLRGQASDIKEKALENIPQYIRQFKEAARQNGAIVMEASNHVMLQGYVATILRSNGALRVVKSKSMLTEECGLNEYLIEQGFTIIDTDLGECIMQLRREPPSHIVLPAIHLRKEEIGETFHKHLGTEAGASDPTYLAQAARKYLREQFLSAQAAITGVNFAVAETGTIVVCTNEGNADMGVHAAPIQIHCMSIEKIIPAMADLGVFTRLLARSATGQAVTAYTSHYRTPKPDGKMYIIIVDNGRSERLYHPTGRSTLKCIRCGACMNTCPVYRRSGGHSYGQVIPGPIGSAIAPFRDFRTAAGLPFACSLCESCSNICPVRINLHEQLYYWRQEMNSYRSTPILRKLIMKTAALVLAKPLYYRLAGSLGRFFLRYFPFMLKLPLRAWTRGRKLPRPERQTFRQWYARNASKHTS